MDHELNGIDLNLLVIFSAMAKHRNTTKASASIRMTQPAFSHALGRLRKITGDELFVRSGRSMIPTPRALEMIGPVEDALRHAALAISPDQTFNPTSSTKIFNILADDYSCQTLLPKLCEKTSQIAPNIGLNIVWAQNKNISFELTEGNVDFGTAVSTGDQQGLYRKPIFKDGFLCLVNKKASQKMKTLTLKKYLEFKHVLISPYGGRSGTVDTELKKIGLKRKTHIVVPHFSVGPEIVQKSDDSIITLPARVAHRYAKTHKLVLFKPPLKLETFTMHLVWHERLKNDPAAIWLRQTIASIQDEI